MKSPVLYSAKYQLLVITLVSVALWYVDTSLAKSYAIGGFIYAIPNLYFVHYAFRYSGAQLAPIVARSFSWGESGKFALAAIGFVLAFRLVETLNKPGLFAGFTSMIVLHWYVAYRIVKIRDESEAD